MLHGRGLHAGTGVYCGLLTLAISLNSLQVLTWQLQRNLRDHRYSGMKCRFGAVM